jgi:hypothetical protein
MPTLRFADIVRSETQSESTTSNNNTNTILSSQGPGLSNILMQLSLQNVRHTQTQTNTFSLPINNI